MYVFKGFTVCACVRVCVRMRWRNSVSRAGPLRLLVITAHLSECYSTWLSWVNGLPWRSPPSSEPSALSHVWRRKWEHNVCFLSGWTRTQHAYQRRLLRCNISECILWQNGWVNSQHQWLFNPPPDPLESLMTANQMHIHTLINQLAANGYAYSTQNTVDSLWNTHNFHFTQDSFLAKWGRQAAVDKTNQLYASQLLEKVHCCSMKLRYRKNDKRWKKAESFWLLN